MNTAGRNAMLKDFEGIVKGLESNMDNRCAEKISLCEKYIKAWFNNLDDLISFVLDNKVEK